MTRAKMEENRLERKMNLNRSVDTGLSPERGTLSVSVMTLGRLLERLTCTETPADSTAGYSETCMSYCDSFVSCLRL